MNPEEVVNEYLAQFTAARATEELPIIRAPATENPRGSWRLLPAVATIVLMLVTYGVFQDSAESLVTSSHALVQAPAPIESPVRETIESDALAATKRQESGLCLEIESTGECRVSATADGQLVIDRLLQSGERVTVVVREEFVLSVGDPEIVYILNGVLGRPFAEAGRPITVQINEGNYHAFLAGSAPEGAATRCPAECVT